MTPATNQFAFLFDLDGVLVDTARFHFVAWRRLANAHGIDFGKEQNELLKGVGRKESLEKILSWGGKSLEPAAFQEAMNQKNDWYLALVDELGPDDLLPGALTFLKEARTAGIKTALGSASKNAKRILDRLDIASLLDAVIDGTHVTRSKPDPEVFLKGAEALGVDPRSCVVFEDAVAGIAAARAAGMKCVGIAEEPGTLEADIEVKDLSALTPANALKLLE